MSARRVVLLSPLLILSSMEYPSDASKASDGYPLTKFCNMLDKPILLLDLGGVVFTSTGRDSPAIDWAVITELNYRYGHDLNVGKDVFPEFMRDYNRGTGLQLSGDRFLQDVFDTLEINRELIDTLRQKNELVIVSDNYRENIAYIAARYRFADWAKRQIYSFDYELTKEDPDFFRRLLTDLAPCRPENLLLLDDSPEKLAAAASVGIAGVLYQSNAQALRELAGLGRVEPGA